MTEAGIFKGLFVARAIFDFLRGVDDHPDDFLQRTRDRTFWCR